MFSIWKFICSGIPLLVLIIQNGKGYMVGNNPGRRAQFLDPDGKYNLEWSVDWSLKTIHFNLTVQTNGWILFGLANNDKASTGADVVIGGVQNGLKPYFLDGFTNNQRRLLQTKLDKSQDYILNSFWENGRKTFLSFSRSLDTCDPQDYPITDNKVTLLWAYGDTDNHLEESMIDYYYNYGQERRGSLEIYLLDPEYTPKIVRDDFGGRPKVLNRENLATWSIPRRIRIPGNDTSYLCSMHKAPHLLRKHHVVGFDIHFADEESQARTHHLLVYKCRIPQGWATTPRALFGSFVDAPATACYVPQMPSNAHRQMPTHFCSQLYIAWAIGGGAYFNPPHVGFPLGSSSSEEEYYMVQVHYDNPQMSQNSLVDLRLDFFYTSRLRSHEGGFLGVGHEVPGVPPSLLIPPNSNAHQIFSHCSPECTKRILPKSGVKFVSMFLHSHTSGQRLRLRHFRENQELSWILYDDNYSNQFQPIRHLRKERQILPGDQLTMDCTYDNTWTNGTVFGGFTTKQEMCMAFIVYYDQLKDYNYCRSEIISEQFRNHFLKISNVSWSQDRLDWVVTSPRHLQGLTVTEVSDNHVNWDGVKRQELERFHQGHSQVGKCSKDLTVRDPRSLEILLNASNDGNRGMLDGIVPLNLDTDDDYHGPVSYPFRARPYIPQKSCSYAG